MKVLGFYDTEVAEYVFRENILLTLIGSVAGVVFGKILHLFVIQTVRSGCGNVWPEYLSEKLYLQFFYLR